MYETLSCLKLQDCQAPTNNAWEPTIGLYCGELRAPIPILTDPFAEQLVFPADPSWTRMLLHAGVILLLSAAHPTRPHPLSALISVCASRGGSW